MKYNGTFMGSMYAEERTELGDTYVNRFPIEYKSKASLKRMFREYLGAYMTNTDKLTGQASWALPARVSCPTGDKLASCKGTPCSVCYASTDTTARKACGLRGTRISIRKGDNSIVAAAYARMHALERILLQGPNSEAWRTSVRIMAAGIYAESVPDAYGRLYMRWHPFGDVFSREYFLWMLDVMRATPDVLHWVPTQERWIAREYGVSPLPNVVIRTSSARVDHVPAGAAVSAVITPSFTGATSGAGIVRCHCVPGAGCRHCRACYDARIRVILYPIH